MTMKRICLTLLFVGLLSVSSYSGAAISAPTGVVASEGTYSNAIIISWDPVPGATGYEAWIINTSNYECYLPPPCEPKDFIITSFGPDHSDTETVYGFLEDNFLFDETNEFRIKAVDDVSKSDFSLPAYGYISEGATSFNWDCYHFEDCTPPDASFWGGGGGVS
jgi:hypothetical protein